MATQQHTWGREHARDLPGRGEDDAIRVARPGGTPSGSRQGPDGYTGETGADSEHAKEQVRREERRLDIPQYVVSSAGALLVGLLYMGLPDFLTFGVGWWLLALELVLLAPSLLALLFVHHPLPHNLARGLTIGLISVLAAALLGALVLLVNDLARVHRAYSLLVAAVLLWGINVLVFAVIYWEVDGEPTARRRNDPYRAIHFRFPQQQEGNAERWTPGFIDYLYLAFNFGTAFSPTESMPLTRRIKLLTMAEAIISLTIILLLISHASNLGFGGHH